MPAAAITATTVKATTQRWQRLQSKIRPYPLRKYLKRSLAWALAKSREARFEAKRRDEARGIKVRATASEIPKAKQMVTAMSLNMTPAMPGTKRIGIKTLTVVKVEAVTAVPTSRAP